MIHRRKLSRTRGAPHCSAWYALVAFALCCCPIACRAGGLPAWLSADLKQIGIPSAAVAVYVKESGTGTTLISHNSTTPFKPASITKLVTTYSALEILGEDYVWHTPVYMTGIVQNGELKGNLIFRGVGDPSLSYERIRAFCAELYRRGIRVIKGDVIIDKSFFAFNAEVPDQFYREAENPWNLPPQPLLVNGKLVTLTVFPDKKTGTAKTSIEPDLPLIRTENRVSMTAGRCDAGLNGIQLDVTGDARNAIIRVSGTLPDQCGPFVKRISVLGPDAYFAASLKKGFEQQGGRIDGVVKPGQIATQARFLGSIPSGSLMEIIRETNKNSNNLMARQLFLAVGAALTGKPPSPDVSERALLSWIAQRMPETSSFVLENGSGLSDEDRVTAKGMVALLEYIGNSRYAAQFLDTLPAVGEDGTMRIRLHEQPVAGRSVAKTGTLRDTRAIAGIVVSQRGRSYIFCMIVNHPRAAAAVPSIDRLIAWLHGLSPADGLGKNLQ